jgi:hypothetical protein
MKSKNEGNWKGLLSACEKYGKENVIVKLEAYHKSLENMSANMWANPEMHNRAHKLDLMLLKQDETLIRLKQMSDEDIKESLKTGLVGVRNYGK